MLPDGTYGNDLLLLTGGRAYSGWKSVRVRRSMEHAVGSFTLGVSQLWPGTDATRQIEPGDKCQVLIGTDRVITGYVDELHVSVEAGAHDVELAGRDATADLVDCSAVRKSGQWRGQKVEAIARDLAEPFGVTVRAEVDTGKPLPSFALQEGETVFEAIERAARIRALLLMTDGNGALVITRAGLRRVATPLVLGENILFARAGLDMRDRFSEYVVKGQAPGSDFFNGPQVSQIRARAVDAGVPRHRPLVLTADAPDLAATLTQRAQWEANVRAARSTQIELSVAGWRHADGLWEPNSLVRVRAEALRLDDELLITQVEYSLDDNGATAGLTLTRADAFSLQELRAPGAPLEFWDKPIQRRPTAGGQ